LLLFCNKSGVSGTHKSCSTVLTNAAHWPGEMQHAQAGAKGGKADKFLNAALSRKPLRSKRSESILCPFGVYFMGKKKPLPD
jgi:hypothetical protein